MTRRLVIFDVDGTLVDSQTHILAAMAQAFAALGQQAPAREQVLSIVGLSLPVAVARLAPGMDASEQARMVAAYKDAFSSLRAKDLSPLYPGAAETLDALSRQDGLVLGIATGKSRRGLDHLVAAHGWAGQFATLQVSDDHPSKPHPAMIHACLRETGIAPEHAVMVGDTTYDMEMARAAGIRGLGVSWGYHPAAALGPHVIDDFAALPAALTQIWSMGVA
ncbi:HAD-IA family hydrolase [Roseinatronobacter alkalisoli]|uniref:HAD-IA family hydrolase n=1 Tax=Roseinatronobacter alkalisoli TaxID=3028235 RepID=A0ABT5T923_9RHOB|nr:HAD-IA family hydrolase [Roseinatronobacter sp. HJB301]MDD7971618.1 HAD-IA family hydrolase [Roseinatronobacter sp. HJB301]